MNQNHKDLEQLQESFLASPFLGCAHPPKVGVYGLYQGRSLVYVGESSSIKLRLRAHALRDDGLSFDAWRAIEAPDIETRKNLERSLINRFHPKWNLKVGRRKIGRVTVTMRLFPKTK